MNLIFAFDAVMTANRFSNQHLLAHSKRGLLAKRTNLPIWVTEKSERCIIRNYLKTVAKNTRKYMYLASLDLHRFPTSETTARNEKFSISEKLT